MINIISGPTCVGKSTFIESGMLKSCSNIAPTSPTIFASNIRNRFNIPRDNCFLHYNIMRPASAAYDNKVQHIKSSYSFSSDKPWKLISKRTVDKKAIVLVTSRSVLARRMKSRISIENNGRNYSRHTYPSSYWLSVLEHLDLHELYAAWISELKQNEIAFTLIKSTDLEYEVITEEQFDSLCLNT